jgi:hypothetical protein
MIARRRLLSAPIAGTVGLIGTSALAGAAGSSVAAAADAQNEAIWRTHYGDTRVWGYVDRHSVDAGEMFNLMLSTRPGQPIAQGRIEIYRIGHYPESDRALVWRSEPLRVFAQPVQITAAVVGAGWTASIEQISSGGWQSGYYTIDFVDDLDGLRNVNVAFIVVTERDRSGDILLALSSNTWQAYNEWGGASPSYSLRPVYAAGGCSLRD